MFQTGVSDLKSNTQMKNFIKYLFYFMIYSSKT